MGRMHTRRILAHNKRGEDGRTKDQALIVHTRRNNRNKEDHHHNRRKDHHHTRQNKLSRDPSNTRCYTYDEK